MQNNYYDKYIKYKKKYLELRGGVHLGSVLLNNLQYIDTMKLNDVALYKDKSDLYVMDILPSNLMWRGYNNTTCINLQIPPGDENDKFRFDPAWYGPPEVAMIYCAMNINDEIMRRSQKNYSLDINSINIDSFIDQYIHIIQHNLSSIVAYSPKYIYQLLDINNTDNLKKLIE